MALGVKDLFQDLLSLESEFQLFLAEKALKFLGLEPIHFFRHFEASVISS